MWSYHSFSWPLCHQLVLVQTYYFLCYLYIDVKIFKTTRSLGSNNNTIKKCSQQLKTASERRSRRFSRRAVSLPEIRKQSDSNFLHPKLYHERRQSDGYNLCQKTDERKHRLSPRVFRKNLKQTKYRQNSFNNTRQYRDKKKCKYR